MYNKYFYLLYCLKGTYDALVNAGGMAAGHIPHVALHEMARLVKPGKGKTKWLKTYSVFLKS